MKSKRTPRLSDAELIKWVSIIGVYRMKELYFTNKIILKSAQVDLLIELGKKEK